MSTAKQKVAIFLVALAAAGAGLLLSQHRGSPGGTSGPAALASLSLADPDGTRHSLAQWRGKVLAVNFWATWCPPCLEEIPEFSRISLEYAAKGVQFVGIGIDTAENVRDFKSRHEVSYPLFIGQNEALQASAALGNAQMALPFTAILSRSGTLVQAKLGKMTAAELKQALDKALAAD